MKRNYKDFIRLKQEKIQSFMLKRDDFPIDFSRDFLATVLCSDDVKTIVDFAVKDENISKIYLCDYFTKKGKQITVLGFNVKNTDEYALFESYQRLFSLLDNDFGHLDTYLIPLDKERKAIKKFLKEKTSLKFDRDAE